MPVRSRYTVNALFGVILVIAAIMAIAMRMQSDVEDAQREFTSVWSTVTPEENAAIFEQQYGPNRIENGILITCLSQADVRVEIEADNLPGQNGTQTALSLIAENVKERHNGKRWKCRISWTKNSIIFTDLNSGAEKREAIFDSQLIQSHHRGHRDVWLRHCHHGVYLKFKSLDVADKHGKLRTIELSLVFTSRK